MDEYVIIHGDKWKSEDIKESVEWAREQNWHKQKWIARAALISKGKTSDYIGQKYNPENTELVDDGFTIIAKFAGGHSSNQTIQMKVKVTH